MHGMIFSTLIIGIFATQLSHAEDIPSIDQVPKPGMVIVEPSQVESTTTDGEYKLVPYTERRSKWGMRVGLGYSSYEPQNYSPAFLQLDYGDVYKAPSVPLVELQIAVKRNFSLGSFGLELGAGMFKAESKAEIDDLSVSSLAMYPIRAGLVYSMDTLFSDEPYVIPYFGGGVYTIFYRESQPGVSFNGNTQVAAYAIGGLALTLDWFDREGSREAYESSGIEGSHLFLEMRKYFATAAATDPDFETDPNWGAGLQIEF